MSLRLFWRAEGGIRFLGWKISDTSRVCLLIPVVHEQVIFVRRLPLWKRLEFFSVPELKPLPGWALQTVLCFLWHFLSNPSGRPRERFKLRAKQFPGEQRKGCEQPNPASGTSRNPCHVVTSSRSNTDASVFDGCKGPCIQRLSTQPSSLNHRMSQAHKGHMFNITQEACFLRDPGLCQDLGAQARIITFLVRAEGIQACSWKPRRPFPPPERFTSRVFFHNRTAGFSPNAGSAVRVELWEGDPHTNFRQTISVACCLLSEALKLLASDLLLRSSNRMMRERWCVWPQGSKWAETVRRKVTESVVMGRVCTKSTQRANDVNALDVYHHDQLLSPVGEFSDDI